MLEKGVVQRHRPEFVQRHHQRRAVQMAPTEPAGMASRGRLPRLTRLMALAIRFEQLLASGAVRDQAELAEIGHVTRARVTQIMNLLHLAPDIQRDASDMAADRPGARPDHRSRNTTVDLRSRLGPAACPLATASRALLNALT